MHELKFLGRIKETLGNKLVIGECIKGRGGKLRECDVCLEYGKYLRFETIEDVCQCVFYALVMSSHCFAVRLPYNAPNEYKKKGKGDAPCDMHHSW